MAFFKRELSPVERFERALKEKQAERQKTGRPVERRRNGIVGKAH